MDNDDYTAKMTELIELLRVIGNDTQQCEVKECKRRISSTITETLSAFSNGNGGYIILGLSEKAGFTPVEGFDARAMQEALSQACEKLTPVVRPVIVTCPFEGANLVFAVIDEMLPREKPCFVSSVGPHGGSYIRTGDGDRKMTAYEVDRLLDEQRQPEHDIAVVPEATLDDLNPTLVHALLECERDRHPHVFAERSDMDMMLDLRILRRMPTGHPADDTVKHAADCDPAGTASREDDTDIGADTDTDEETRIASVPRPTLAGLLAVGRYPQKFFPRLNVTIAVYPGTSRDDVFTGNARLVASETITGPIPIMIDDAVGLADGMDVRPRRRRFRRATITVATAADVSATGAARGHRQRVDPPRLLPGRARHARACGRVHRPNRGLEPGRPVRRGLQTAAHP